MNERQAPSSVMQGGQFDISGGQDCGGDGDGCEDGGEDIPSLLIEHVGEGRELVVHFVHQLHRRLVLLLRHRRHHTCCPTRDGAPQLQQPKILFNAAPSVTNKFCLQIADIRSSFKNSTRQYFVQKINKNVGRHHVYMYSCISSASVSSSECSSSPTLSARPLLPPSSREPWSSPGC